MASFSDLKSLVQRPSDRNPTVEPLHPIVIIDDDPAMRSGLALLLQDRYQVTLCSSAQEGVDAVNDTVCAVILDVKMPDFDGFWACGEIRKKASDVPVIFYSAYQNQKD